MPGDSPSLTILLNDPDADVYARLIAKRFPHVRAIEAANRRSLEENIGQADALLASRISPELLCQAKNLRWIQSAAAGVESMLPIRDQLIGRIVVTNVRGLHGEGIADFVMGGVTMLHWDFMRFLREQSERKWIPRPVAPLAEKTLGVVGLGSIGTTIARRAKGAGMTVFGLKRDTSVPIDVVDRLFSLDALHNLLPLCDFVVLALPATPDTTGLIGAPEIARMRSDAFLINIGRGNAVVEAELIKALQTNAIAGAMLDVFEQEPLPHNSPLWDLPNVIVTPHVSGTQPNYTDRVFPILADNIERLLSGQALKNVIDLQRGY
ncbi:MULTISPECIES: D-2-hydroxyacid dehydrogenase [Bradyrhizobium]|uniref:D-2-hydroxyacid dehydrogenase n=1 Tax=Bradyrhizobium TaxID=374 RepID=UPI000231DB6A|nr:D-2-hydroxyacid dehydrogenase [Bradyrhizobium japonicum]AJA65502.1 hydroxyacid dehydrogenase [Bradyrhizobium japonicum]KMK00039.1 hydroxyacid dehydrogenase [Bradyrhizobium japonicum]MCS3537372.1 phosphoglycerate dehydrogenase-like enzyme [Bradyrhizobium japonicum]MCS3986541.1 phosphoglycerate dehydrogenase-like enzyme [Bradyrhizobium japonicum]MCS4018645.1 phosphoglycerate dehydrogenase-like enzyme [Bradyrhizobium japonicum]